MDEKEYPEGFVLNTTEEALQKAKENTNMERLGRYLSRPKLIKSKPESKTEFNHRILLSTQFPNTAKFELTWRYFIASKVSLTRKRKSSSKQKKGSIMQMGSIYFSISSVHYTKC